MNGGDTSTADLPYLYWQATPIDFSWKLRNQGGGPLHLSEQTVLRRSTTVVSRDIASETLVVPIRGGVGDLDSIFSFNPIGSDLWKLLAENTSIGDLASWVEDHYEVSRQIALRDIEAFINDLLDAGLASIAALPATQSQPGMHASS